jgi:hypothetical protein
MLLHPVIIETWQAIVLSLVVAIIGIWLIDRLVKINNRFGKTVEQSGGLFTEYDHYWIWSWLRFPKEVIAVFHEINYLHGWYKIKTVIRIAFTRCNWAMKYKPLYATREQVLEYYRRVKWAKVPPPLPPDDNIAPPAIKL